MLALPGLKLRIECQNRRSYPMKTGRTFLSVMLNLKYAGGFKK